MSTRSVQHPLDPNRSVLVLILGTAEWDSPIGTNQHYVTRELAVDFACHFIEGVGTRQLRLNWEDLRRILKRILPARASARRGRAVPPGVAVLSPRILPTHAPRLRGINRALLRAQLRSWLRHPGPKVLWSFTPYTHGLELEADAAIYHLVDLLHENPGVNSRRLQNAERKLARGCSLAIGTSAAVARHLTDVGFDRVLERPNVADVGVFERATQGRIARGEKSVVFMGALSPHKLDFELLEQLAGGLQGKATLRLIGPIPQGHESHARVKRIQSLGAKVEPPLPIESLAEEVSGAHVGIIPYQMNALTAGISPLKIYEYLASGLPVVSTPLPSVAAVQGCVWVEPGTAGFVSRVLDLVQVESTDEERKRRQELGRRNDWSVRGAEYRGLVRSLLE